MVNGSDLTMEKINAERITKVEEKLDRGLDNVNNKLDAMAQSVAQLVGTAKTAKKEMIAPWIALCISIIIGVGGMLQQQISFQADQGHQVYEDMAAEVLRIRRWKDETEQTVPAYMARSDVHIESLGKSMDTMEERLTYLTKKFFEFQTCLGVVTSDKAKGYGQ